ncbi:MAG TPA: hypothetical protein VGO67_01960 [Verrucomicrobiae bacterium]
MDEPRSAGERRILRLDPLAWLGYGRAMLVKVLAIETEGLVVVCGHAGDGCRA